MVIEILVLCGCVFINIGNGCLNNEIVLWVRICVGYGCL